MRLHLLCTESKSLQIFWFKTSACRFSHDLSESCLLLNLFFGKMVGSQNSAEKRATGLIRLSKSINALSTSSLLYLYKTFEIAYHALLALSASSFIENFMDPDGFKLIPKYWYVSTTSTVRLQIVIL